jgi:hypothetical protein
MDDIKKLIRGTKSIKDKGERLNELRFIAEGLANQFTYDMGFLEDEIEFVLERTPAKIKEELGWSNVCDVTQDINVTSSSDWPR